MANWWFLGDVISTTIEEDFGSQLRLTLCIEDQHNAAAELWGRHLCCDNRTLESIERLISPSSITRVDVSTPSSWACWKPPQYEDIFLGRTIRGYTFQSVIKSGGTATVYKVEKNGRTYAAKVSLPNQLHPDTISKAWATELSIMSQLKHKNIIGVYDLFPHHGLHVIIMEYFDGCDLADFIACNNKSQRQRALKKIARQLVKAIKYFHKHNIAHRDIKPANVLIGKDLKVKIIDFGGAMKLRPEDTLLDRKPTISTPQYTPPEVHARERRSSGDICMKAFDMWSLGVSLYESLTGKRPNFYNSTMGTDTVITQPDFSVFESRDRRLLCLVKKCLDMNPESRITAKTALKEKYFRRF
ncbi:serine/threonine-protein kinase PLK4-like [Haliotis rufescens]|uniref:serine/threonine-protein kinase PLK4-like n=1 Tax=Haliotis rufescens TaxID=6454 RepID=UPI001EB05176|nr:serine/threonine-protein kinase PLK4-like [Haliotis rufescens]